MELSALSEEELRRALVEIQLELRVRQAVSGSKKKERFEEPHQFHWARATLETLNLPSTDTACSALEYTMGKRWRARIMQICAKADTYLDDTYGLADTLARRPSTRQLFTGMLFHFLFRKNREPPLPFQLLVGVRQISEVIQQQLPGYSRAAISDLVKGYNEQKR